jgi:hypothetical protein
VLGVMSLGLCVWGCDHSWDDFDPRVGGGTGGGTGASGSGSGGGGTGGAPMTASSSSSAGASGDGGATSSGAMGGNGASGGGTAGEGGGAIGPCEGSGVLKGRFVTWCGKVNVHRGVDDAEWTGDTDCVSGCNINDVGYCQKYWPTSTAVIPVRLSPEDKPFQSAQCATLTFYPGELEYLCCGP